MNYVLNIGVVGTVSFVISFQALVTLVPPNLTRASESNSFLSSHLLPTFFLSSSSSLLSSPLPFFPGGGRDAQRAPGVEGEQVGGDRQGDAGADGERGEEPVELLDEAWVEHVRPEQRGAGGSEEEAGGGTGDEKAQAPPHREGQRGSPTIAHLHLLQLQAPKAEGRSVDPHRV